MHKSKCPTCGNEHVIVNFCGCDPRNLPTIIATHEVLCSHVTKDGRIDEWFPCILRTPHADGPCVTLLRLPNGYHNAELDAISESCLRPINA